jgi:hypothetical protein
MLLAAHSHVGLLSKDTHRVTGEMWGIPADVFDD